MNRLDFIEDGTDVADQHIAQDFQPRRDCASCRLHGLLLSKARDLIWRTVQPKRGPFRLCLDELIQRHLDRIPANRADNPAPSAFVIGRGTAFFRQDHWTSNSEPCPWELQSLVAFAQSQKKATAESITFLANDEVDDAVARRFRLFGGKLGAFA